VTEEAPTRWNGWGDARRTFDFHGRADALWAFLEEALAHPARATPAEELARLSLPELRLGDGELDALRGLVGAEHVRVDAAARAAHALGRSYRDLLRLRAGEPGRAVPDAVLRPGDHDGVQAILGWAHEREVAVVPFGSGSSVVGGVEALAGPHRAAVSVDLRRLSRLLDFDPISRVATFEAGVEGPALEAALESRGHLLGHHPQSFEHSTLGGWIAARGAGQKSNRYGTMAERLVGARLATPVGEWIIEPHPHSAAGPDLTQVIAGSEGALGVITEATVSVHALPERRRFAAFLFRDFPAGAAAVRTLVQAELPLTTVRLSDADETYFYGALRKVLRPGPDRTGPVLRTLGLRRPCALLLVLEGEGAAIDAAYGRTLYLGTRAGGLFVGTGPARSWHAGRFDSPYLRDPMMDQGFGVDTLETATRWSNVEALHARVREAIEGAFTARGERVLVLAHVSHAYPDGASLYFTFVFGRDREDPEGQWRAAKDAASDAIRAGGGTISHHHGVGLDHRRWMDEEVGDVGLRALRGLKAAVDPKGILNPGKLLG
jgi:alkyldihydroxyacetonephosphate synthase